MRIRLVAGLVLLALALTACSSSDDNASEPADGDAATTTTAAAAEPAAPIVFNGQGNDLAAYETEPPFKKQIVQEYAAGATLNGLAREHDLSRNLIRIWVAKSESGEFDPDVEAATLLADYEAKIVALERMVGRQALEIELLKRALQQGRSQRPRCWRQ